MRGLFAILFLLLMAGIGYMVVTNGTGGGGVETDLRVASEHDDTVRDLDRLIEDARKNARRAADLAARIEEAAAETDASAEDVLALSDDNDVARASSRAAERAAEDALGAARLMRAYADRMNERFLRTETYTDDAETAARQLETVERTQAEARAAARKAAQARADLAAAEETLDRVEAGIDEDDLAPINVTRDDGGSIVILNDGPVEAQGDADYDDLDEDVDGRLREIFPDDVIEYEEDVPYGERG